VTPNHARGRYVVRPKREEHTMSRKIFSLISVLVEKVPKGASYGAAVVVQPLQHFMVMAQPTIDSSLPKPPGG
jgi:hypothetical protein